MPPNAVKNRRENAQKCPKIRDNVLRDGAHEQKSVSGLFLPAILRLNAHFC